MSSELRHRSSHDAELLSISEQEIRRNGPGHLLRTCWRQWRCEQSVRRRKSSFRTTDPDALEPAYAEMTFGEFCGINGRQNWANWRTIPRSMNALVPNRPLRILDLGCGSGGSTRALAFYAPLGSTILGYDLAEPLLDIAHDCLYLHSSGQPVEVEFALQSLADPWCDPEGRRLPPASVDLVNSSGVIGHHVDYEVAQQLGQELARVVAPGGLVFLDIGPRMSARDLTLLMAPQGFRRLRRTRSCWFDRGGQVVFEAL